MKTAEDISRRARWHGARTVAMAIAFPAVGALIAYFAVDALVPADNTFAKRRALCDEMVAKVLHSTDLVEVTRATFIVRYMDCSISQRL